MCYCVRERDETSSLFTWPLGQYCIAKKGDCPHGFEDGSIFWDDENDLNKNQVEGVLPDGSYNEDTRIDYCCRADGLPSTNIYLPNTQAFSLYPHDEDVCQTVHGMEHTLLFVDSDDEDRDNTNTCTGDYPFLQGSCHEDHKLYICHYEPNP